MATPTDAGSNTSAQAKTEPNAAQGSKQSRQSSGKGSRRMSPGSSSAAPAYRVIYSSEVAASAVLPWPPTINTYWRKRPNGMYITAKGRAYRTTVQWVMARCKTITGRLAVSIVANPPDRKKRDLDNLPKALLDALTHAGLWDDDSQIDALKIVRGEVVKGGVITIDVDQHYTEVPF